MLNANRTYQFTVETILLFRFYYYIVAIHFTYLGPVRTNYRYLYIIGIFKHENVVCFWYICIYVSYVNNGLKK